LHSKRFK